MPAKSEVESVYKIALYPSEVNRLINLLEDSLCQTDDEECSCSKCETFGYLRDCLSAKGNTKPDKVEFHDFIDQ